METSIVSVTQSVARYSTAQRFLHWLMALIIFAAIGLGIYAANLEPGTPLRRALLFVHESLGMTALILLVIRVFYRFSSAIPPYAQPLSKVSLITSRIGHLTLYVLMLVMPISGYVYSVTSGHVVPWFGLFNWPSMITQDEPLSHQARVIHHWGANILFVTLASHLAAVVWHQIVKKDHVLYPMLSSSK